MRCRLRELSRRQDTLSQGRCTISNTDWLQSIPGWQAGQNDQFGIPVGAKPRSDKNPFRVGVAAVQPTPEANVADQGQQYGIPAGANLLNLYNPYRIGVGYSTQMPSWYTAEQQRRATSRIGPYLTNTAGQQVYAVPYLEGDAASRANAQSANVAPTPTDDASWRAYADETARSWTPGMGGYASAEDFATGIYRQNAPGGQAEQRALEANFSGPTYASQSYNPYAAYAPGRVVQGYTVPTTSVHGGYGEGTPPGGVRMGVP